MRLGERVTLIFPSVRVLQPPFLFGWPIYCSVGTAAAAPFSETRCNENFSETDPVMEGGALFTRGEPIIITGALRPRPHGPAQEARIHARVAPGIKGT